MSVDYDHHENEIVTLDEKNDDSIDQDSPSVIIGTVSEKYTMDNGLTFEFQRNSGISKYVWPFPRQGQRVPYPEKWRRYTDESKTKENPFAYFGFGLWWFSYVLFGCDRQTLKIPKEKYEQLAKQTGWNLDDLLKEDDKPNFEGPNQVWLTDYIHNESYPEQLSNRLNIQTLPEIFKVGKVLNWLYAREHNAMHLFVLVMYSMLIPVLWSWILYGLIPLGNFKECGMKAFGVYIFVTNPLTEVVWVFADLTLMFGALDPKLPWRPFWLYLPVLIVVYLAQVCLFSAVNLTVGTFTCQGLVARALTTGISYLYYWLLQDKIYGFEMCPPMFRGLTWQQIKDTYTKKVPVTEEQHERWKNWLKISFWRSILYYIYAGYTIGLKLSSGALQTILPILLSIMDLAFRKIVQRQGMPFHRDINFLLSGLTAYSMTNTVVAFSTANINIADDEYKTNYKTYVTMFLIPVGTITTVFMNQSEIWFRFRNWIKKTPQPAFKCQELDTVAFSIEEEMNPDSRGVINDHPGYRRTKMYYDFLSIWGALTGYGSYLAVSWLLVVGPNNHDYPYNEDYSISNTPFTKDDWLFSLIFCAVVFVILLLMFLGFMRFFHDRFQNVYPFARSVQLLWSEHPYKMGYASLIFSVVLADTISMYLSFNRVWFADIGDTLGSCRN